MLIKCPECGKEISDKSDVCVNCGYPIKDTLANETSANIETKNDPQESNSVQSAPINSAISNTQDIKKANVSSSAKAINKKWIAIIAVAVIAVVGIVFISNNSLNKKEQYVYKTVSKYRDYLKDPDSLIIRGEILYVVTSENDRFVVFSASGNNSYGASVTSMPMFLNGSYVGEYDDDPNELEDPEAGVKLARANYIVALWRLSGSAMANSKGYEEAELISGKKIASKLHCKWKE